MVHQSLQVYSYVLLLHYVQRITPCLTTWWEFQVTWVSILTLWIQSQMALDKRHDLSELGFLIHRWAFYKDSKQWRLADKSHSQNVSCPDFKLSNTALFYFFIFFNDSPALYILFMVWTQTNHIDILTPDLLAVWPQAVPVLALHRHPPNPLSLSAVLSAMDNNTGIRGMWV